MKNQLHELYGDIDIYLFDQLLKGRFDDCTGVIDIGCGYGRNLHYFLRNNYEVYGMDHNPQTLEEVRALSQRLAPGNPAANFMNADVTAIPFEEGSFDIAISSAVLHFAKDKTNFEQMLHSNWSMIKPGGYFFARLASDIGIEALVADRGNGRFLLPDGSVRYLVNQQQLLDYTQMLGGTLFEPIKTTNVQNMRCMTTWCVQKNTA